MFNNLEHKKSLMDARVINMRVMKWCLEKYKKTLDESYFDWAKVFGDWSKKYQKDINELK